ncbi:MAG: HEPN domain-containing protein [Rhizobiaceae bacterium]|nr:HEPN domain-containing protein [Rhizobiaceae bacterium]
MIFDVRPVEVFYDDQNSILDSLVSSGQVSLASDFRNIFSKSLVIVSASYFESYFREIVQQALRKHSLNDKVFNFGVNKGVERQYHTWFDWKGGRVNPFFAMFGEECINKYKTDCDGDSALKNSAKNFIEIGQSRNLIVHDNFLTYNLNKTPDEVLSGVRSSILFLNYCSEQLL